MVSSCLKALDRTQRLTAVSSTPLDERSARSRDLYLTIHNTHKKQISMNAARFEFSMPATVRPSTHALDRATTRTSA